MILKELRLAYIAFVSPDAGSTKIPLLTAKTPCFPNIPYIVKIVAY